MWNLPQVSVLGVFMFALDMVKHLDEVPESEPIVRDIDAAAEWILRYSRTDMGSVRANAESKRDRKTSRRRSNVSH